MRPVYADSHSLNLDKVFAYAYELARLGADTTVNPQVGCVLLDGAGRKVAAGWHNGAGTPHAEVAALAKLPTKWLSPAKAKQLTAVITLEPCNHTGRTPPCTQALIAAGIGQVIYGAKDPGPHSGGGAQILEKANITVKYVQNRASAQLLKEWQQRQQKLQNNSSNAGTENAKSLEKTPKYTGIKPQETRARPRVVLKWAQTLDGYIAAKDGTSKWITAAAALNDVHKRRAQADLIACGTGTLIADNPTLTARKQDGTLLVAAEKQPVPVIFGKRALPAGSKVCTHPALSAHKLTEPLRCTGENLSEDLQNLNAMGYQSLFVDGGATLITAFIRANLYDELLIYIAPALLGAGKSALGELGAESINDILRYNYVERINLEQDTLFRVLRE